MVELKKKAETAESSRDNAEEELKKALRLIEQLRQQNADLQEQIARLEKAKKKLSEEVIFIFCIICDSNFLRVLRFRLACRSLRFCLRSQFVYIFFYLFIYFF